MTDITNEEQIRIDKEKRAARVKELADKTDAEKAVLMSIRERLENKLETDTIDIKLKDNLGDFKVRFNKLSTHDWDAYNRARKEFALVQIDIEALNKAGKLTKEARTEFEEKEKAHSEYMYAMFERQSLDGLTADFWRNGTEYSPDLLKIVLDTIITESISTEKYLAEVKSFR